MAHQILPRAQGGDEDDVWKVVRKQHGVIARGQLLRLGYSTEAIKHRIASGRLHPLWRGVYAVGRPDVGRRGRWMAATLICGPEALLSHRSAAELWGIGQRWQGIDVVVPHSGWVSRCIGESTSGPSIAGRSTEYP
jgi:hypothetical protein